MQSCLTAQYNRLTNAFLYSIFICTHPSFLSWSPLLFQDFSFALKLFNEHVLKPESQKSKTGSAPSDSTKPGKDSDSKHKKHRSDSTSQSGTKRPSGPGGKDLRDNRPPIIIVPSGLSGIISSMNAADFLENSSYVTIEEKRKSGAPREKERLISRILPNGVRSKYLLIDNPKLGSKDWERVVAVFATGQGWQFKDWPAGYMNPVELFSKVRNLLFVCLLQSL